LINVAVQHTTHLHDVWRFERAQICTLSWRRFTERSSDGPQLLLIFSDGTYLEIWGDINAAGGLDPGGLDKVRHYLSESTEIVFEALQ
jgi:hypothetical protein